ncbi:MAG: DUF3617 domain-containing protein, partial [Gammaproteobacteria bacterium]|nr:DUF3617 domain-containing protein [Gammaproteobacteria bacterium]
HAEPPKEMPKRKPGLWEIKMTTEGGEMLSQHCIDEKTDDLMQQRTQAMGKQECSKNNVRREGGKVLAESVCKFGGATVNTNAVFSGDFSSNYTGNIDTIYNPPMMGREKSHSTIAARWLGACKPGQKPGDVIMPGMPGGGKFNIEEMMKMMPKQ